jgi:hypothetical protein
VPTIKPKQNDPVIDEVREIRQRISARFNHDPAQLVAYDVELQKQYQSRLVDAEKIRDRASGA